MGLLWFVVTAARKLLPAWRAPSPRGADAPPVGNGRQTVFPALAAHRGHDGGRAATLSLPSCRSTRSLIACECRPLRVVRVRESGRLPGHAGRMKISGRMADVCAELDRLAAHEDFTGSP